MYQEFLELIFPIDNCIDPEGDNVQIDAEYAIGIWQKKIGSTPVTTLSTKPKTRALHKYPPVIIELIPNDPEVFKKELLIKKQAKFELTFTDGSVVAYNWNAYKFSADSQLIDNIKSKLNHRTDRDKIVKAVFEV